MEHRWNFRNKSDLSAMLLKGNDGPYAVRLCNISLGGMLIEVGLLELEKDDVVTVTWPSQISGERLIRRAVVVHGQDGTAGLMFVNEHPLNLFKGAENVSHSGQCESYSINVSKENEMATEAELKVKNEKAQQKAPAKVLSGELDMFRDFERRFDDFFSRRWLRPWHLDWPSLGEMRRALDIRIPSVDVIDGDREIKIKCELPGVDKKDLEVTATDEAVTIRGESRREEKEEKKIIPGRRSNEARSRARSPYQRQ